MAISREAVIQAYRIFLDRAPESEDAIRVHLHAANENELAQTLLASQEFALRKSRVPAAAPVVPVQNPVDEKWHSAGKTRVLVVGNCQAAGIAELMSTMAGDIAAKSLLTTADVMNGLTAGTLDLEAFIQADLVFAHSRQLADALELRIPNIRGKFKRIPSIVFSAFHPDCAYVFHGTQNVISPIGAYSSALVFFGWKHGLTPQRTLRLFTEDVYEKLGYFRFWRASTNALAKSWAICGLELGDRVSRWSRQGSWMHSINHPKLQVLADLAQTLLTREGVHTVPGVEAYLKDALSTHPCWPVYPEIGSRLGIPDLPAPYFKKGDGMSFPDLSLKLMPLEAFIAESFERYGKHAREDLYCENLQSRRFLKAHAFLDRIAKGKPPKTPKTRPDAEGATLLPGDGNPYKSLPDPQFWRRAIERVAMTDVDPVLRGGFLLKPADKVATAGSCFAQHISNALKTNGFNYYVAEAGDSALDAGQARLRNYGVFSSRFGNIYTARQLVQLFDRAYGRYTPRERHWKRDDGRFVDPFRPLVEPDGFASVVDLELDRTRHFEAVRSMFENLDVLVFTLGLTEAWRDRFDGAVFPVAPGVMAGDMNPEKYEFVNFGYAEVVADFQAFMHRLAMVNPAAKILLTVSPVPLIATYENRHVLVSTTESKAVLRAAAAEITRKNAACQYFPSYEIITGGYTRGRYFEDDLRSIAPEGVAHVMRLFLKHYSSEAEAGSPNAAEPSLPVETEDAFEQDFLRESAAVSEIICDEEVLDQRR